MYTMAMTNAVAISTSTTRMIITTIVPNLLPPARDTTRHTTHVSIIPIAEFGRLSDAPPEYMGWWIRSDRIKSEVQARLQFRVFNCTDFSIRLTFSIPVESPLPFPVAMYQITRITRCESKTGGSENEIRITRICERSIISILKTCIQ